MGKCTDNASSVVIEKSAQIEDKSVLVWQIVDAASGVKIGPDYPDGTGTPDGVASEIRERCRKTFAHRIYQFFWTNGTLEYARKVWLKLSKKDGVREVRLLESSNEGIEMENNVNKRLVDFVEQNPSPGQITKTKLKELKKERKLWPYVFETKVKSLEKYAKNTIDETMRAKTDEQLAKIDKLKNDLEKYQRDTSMNYANKATVKCFLVRFRKFDKNGIMKSGEYSIIEDNVLKVKKLAFHLFVQIGYVE